MTQAAWWRPESGEWPEWMDADDVPFAGAIDAMLKCVVYTTLDAVDWDAELLDGDLVNAVRRLKEQPGRGISLGGVQLPAALAAAV